MKAIGYILITLGFIAASLVAVVETRHVDWLWFSLTFVVGVIGVVVIRSSTKKEAMHEETLTSNMKNIEASLERIVKDVKEIRGQLDPTHPQAIHALIDEKLTEDLQIFVDARKSIGLVHGLNAYAEVMNHFATGERYLNRVWSASADGYIDEVTEYLQRTEEQFIQAYESIRELDKKL